MEEQNKSILKRCPNAACMSRKINVHSKKHQRYRCRTCGKTWVANYASVFYGLKKPPESFEQVYGLYLAGHSIREMAGAVSVSTNTILSWIKKFETHFNHQET